MHTLDAESFPAIRRGSAGHPVWLVLKFGGTSVSTARNWQTIHSLIRERLEAGYRPFVVHSALARISNAIQSGLEAALHGEQQSQLNFIRKTHLDLAGELGLDGEAIIGEYLQELQQLFAGIHLIREISPRVHARCMAMGELMATRLGVAYLQMQGMSACWLDAREVLHATSNPNLGERSRYLNATCNHDADPSLQQCCAALSDVIVTQGFIASDERGDTVILGRGGSDTSGAYFAARLQAAGLEIWTDVPGMFTADPRVVQGARLLRTLSYAEAQEIASTGGSVLHPRCVGPVRRHRIPLRVKDTMRPELPGTLVTADPGSDAPRLKAISGRERVTLVSMETVGMWQEVGFLADAFRCFSDLGLSVDLVSTAESNVTVTLDPGANAIDAGMLERLRQRLERLCRVQIIENVEVVSLVGQKIRTILHEIGPAFDVFEEFRVHLVSQAASDLNLSFVVEEGQSRRLIQRLHGLLIRPSPRDAVFGPTWEELQAKPPQPVVLPEPWWARRREELIRLAREHSSAYVYDLATVRAAVERLQSLRSVERVLFAMKSNNHPAVLRVIHDAGLGFECVSPGEISRLLELFPNLERRRILFTPNFAPRREYEQALKQGVWVTLDNLHPLRHWPEMFHGQQIFLRVDTGHGYGHHEHVRTAGVHSKFGIPVFELPEAAQLVERTGARVVGLHAHAGSGILRADNWREVARVLGAAAGDFPQLRILDVGGGLGVPEKRDQQALDLAELDAGLAEIRAAWPHFAIWLEPGRYLVAEAGALVTTVTQTKGKGDVRYVGVSTGMNSLIRPALYGAYHEIANISRWGSPATEIVNVVGPNCESGDRLGTDRLLPPCAEGDVLVVATAGAYGHVMSSHYNLREPAVEVAI